MTSRTRAGLLARLGLTAAVLLPYWRFLTFSVVFVTDDYFASDIFNGELPGRVLVGQALRSAHWPAWTSRICSGYPLVGAPADPLGMGLFTLLPPAAALDALIVALLLVAAHGAYSLARRFEADGGGAMLAGIAFAGCGYIAAQLKHLSIVSTIVWLPVGLLLLDRAFASAEATAPWRRARDLALFGIVFGVQALCGFPQSAYICALVYGSFALFRAVQHRAAMESPRAWLRWLAVAAAAIALGAAAGAVVMLPLAKLGGISDRAEPLGWDWATRLAYWPPNAAMFLFPYANGDIANNTYQGPPFFWEDYGYLGILTFLLAIHGAVRERRRAPVGFVIAATVVAYLFVLGRATPIYHLAFTLIPGISMFRFPTRFLIVVELGVALLAAVGLTRLRQDLTRRWPAPSVVPTAVSLAIVLATIGDLFFHQPRQNPVVPAETWLAPPASVALVREGGAQPRTFTPRHRDLHHRTFQLAHGWADVQPYFDERDVLAPNLGGGLWDVPSGDCYVGISPRWYVDVWGDHNRELSLMSLLAANDFNAGVLRVRPNLPSILAAYGVTHLLSAFPVSGAELPFAGRAGTAYVYRVNDAARVRVVQTGRPMSEADAAKRLLDPAFDATREVLLLDAPPDVAASTGPATIAAAADPSARASITRETFDTMTVDASSATDAFLLLADTFSPGWSADVDGRAVPILRANLSVRAVPLPRGTHVVHFRYQMPGLAAGQLVSAGAALLLLGWAAAAAYAGRVRPARR